MYTTIKHIVTLTFFLFMVPNSMGESIMESDGAVSPGSTFALTAKEREKFSKLAETGDGDAAFVLYQYYTFSFYDEAKATFWLRLSAKSGNVTAMYNWAKELQSLKKFEQALYWAKLAELNGDAQASELISELGNSIRFP